MNDSADGLRPEEQSAEADRVVVGVDGSAPSITALRYGARIADVFDAPLEAVCTWTRPALIDSYVISGWSPEEDAGKVLDDAISEAFASAPPPHLTRTVLPGPAAGVLVDVSRTAGVLVLGNRGHGGFAGLLLGSVSTTCAAHAKCPVLIVHDGAKTPDLPRSAHDPGDA